ncbi:MAG TPA: CYTH domain-containing protein, partial [Vicinamibacterales bacterium]|nr:CYTH domain-containing protein [Vicinamibacterales bacterium]
MSATLEREIKLPFESAEAARAAVLATGATPLKGRRLQEDCLLDTTNDDLRRRRSALRVRQDGGRCILTFKGPVQPGEVKVREEIETMAGDGTLLMRILGELG